MKNPIEKVKAAIDKFHALQDKYASFGAWDSEINWKFTNVVNQAANGKHPVTPEGVRGWELYEMPGAKKVAQVLTRQADRVANAILNTPIGDIKKYFGDR